MQMLIGKKISLSCLYCAVEEAPSAAPRPHGWFGCSSTPLFFKIFCFLKHLFFFSLPSGHAHSQQQNEVSFLVWENKMPFPGFHIPGVLTFVASPFQAVQVLFTIICLSLASLNEIPPNTISSSQTGRKLHA